MSTQDEISKDRIELWRTSFGEGASDAEFGTFVELVRRTGLSPEARQIYLVKRWDKQERRYAYTPLTGIDGYRLVADRTSKYAGNDDPIFDDERQPFKATVTVFKLIGGIRCPFTASARWDQYYPGDAQGFMWRKMPHLMLGKCAEALALRKAFPAELSGLYTDSEMEQAQAQGREAEQHQKGANGAARRDAPPALPPPPGNEPYNHEAPVHKRLLADAFRAELGVSKLSDEHVVMIRKCSAALAAERTPIGCLDEAMREWGRLNNWGRDATAVRLAARG